MATTTTTTPVTQPPLDPPDNSATSDGATLAPRRLNLSATQVCASALAAITATVAASYLGIAGTVIGAAVASVLTVVGNAVYSHSIQSTRERVRTVVPAAARRSRRPTTTTRPATPTPATPTRRATRQRRGVWRVMAGACVGVFAGVLILVTVVELVAGRPLSDLMRGQRGSGTTVLGTVQHQQGVRTTPAPTVTITAHVVTSTPTVTITAPTVTQTTTPTTTVGAPAHPSGSTSAVPSGSSAGSGSPGTSGTAVP